MIEEFDKYFKKKELQYFSHLLHQAFSVLLRNKQGGGLNEMCIHPGISSECKTLGGIVVHTVAVLAAVPDQSIFLPFWNMLTKPGDLAVSKIQYACVKNTG